MIWKCNQCGADKDVKNGVCKKCGPTQTTPIDAEAKEAAGIVDVVPQEEDLDE